MIIDKVEFKYSKGDKVRYIKDKCYQAPWRNPSSNIPVTERTYTIDGYGFDVTDKGIQKWYLFHAYCDDYFGYHEKVNEELLNPFSEPTQNVMEDIHFQDGFGVELEIGDHVYHDVYSFVNGEFRLHSLIWMKEGDVKGFRYSYNDNFHYGFTVMMCNALNAYNGHLHNGTGNLIERCDSFCKTLPDKKTMINDMLSFNSDFYNYQGDFGTLSDRTRKGLEFLAITEEEFNEGWNTFKEEKKKKKKTTKPKKTTKKKTTDDKLLEKLSKMSESEKKKLLKLLQEDE